MEKKLLEKKIWAVAGANQNPEKYGNKIYKRLKEKGDSCLGGSGKAGHKVYLVSAGNARRTNPKKGQGAWAKGGLCLYTCRHTVI